MKKVLSLMSMKKLFKLAGAKSVGLDAAIEMRKQVEDYAGKIGRKAVRNALLDGRKTIKKEDVEVV